MIREISDRFVPSFPFTWVKTNASSSLQRKSAMNHSQLQSSVAAAWRMQIDAKWMLLWGRQFVICVDSSEQINQRYQAVKNHHDVGPDASCKMASYLRINVLGRSRLRLSRDLRKLRQKPLPIRRTLHPSPHTTFPLRSIFSSMCIFVTYCPSSAAGSFRSDTFQPMTLMPWNISCYCTRLQYVQITYEVCMTWL